MALVNSVTPFVTNVQATGSGFPCIYPVPNTLMQSSGVPATILADNVTMADADPVGCPSLGLPTGVTINWVNAVCYSKRTPNNAGTDTWNLRVGGINGANTVTSANGIGSCSELYLLNPVTGLAWTRAQLFSTSFGFRVSATTGSTGWDIYGFYLEVSYTIPSPTEVDITGDGGVTISGAAGTGIGMVGTGGMVITDTGSGGIPNSMPAQSGTPSELHMNQWGLLQFVLRSRLEEEL